MRVSCALTPTLYRVIVPAMNKTRILLLIVVLLVASLACRVEDFIPAPQPTETPTPSVPLAPTATPTPTPIPTPLPGARVESGDTALFNGDWDTALSEYARALDTATENEVKAAALLGLGRTYLKTGQLNAALEALNNALGSYPDTNSQADLYFTLGEVQETLGQPAAAADSFLRYQQLRPGLIDAYLYSRIGDNHLTAGDQQAAINAYSLSIQAPGIRDEMRLNLLIADAYLAMDDLSPALVAYEDVYNRTLNDFQKAEARRKMGDLLIGLGRYEEGYRAYQEVVENYPVSYDAYLAITTLLDAGIEADDLNRGLINYFVKQYGLAVDAFVRYLREYPNDHNDTAHYYLGLSYLNLGEYTKAVEAWEQILDDHTNDRNWANAFDEIAYTQSVFLGKPDQAIETYLEFVDRSPLHERAPEFLYYAARTAERDFDLKTAARLWERIGTQFSTSTWAFDGLFQAGIARYRLREYSNATTLWQSALGVTANPGEEAAAYFWIGKAYQASGYPDAANDAWLQASTTDPTGYYSERALDLLEGREPFATPGSYNLNVDLVTGRQEAVDWMRATFKLGDEINLTDTSTLFVDPRMVRGAELWKLGQYEAARLEFESYRQDIEHDPVRIFLLAEFLIDLGLYRSGVIAARQVLDLAGLDDAGTFTAPDYFNHLRFGAYYKEIVLPAAEQNGFHPLFLYAVMRQESLFEGFVTSTAGARGLMQIIPSTGAEIAGFLGWPQGYTADDLYRPIVSIPFGASYLDRQRDYFSGDLYAALSAYNGGAGNATRWLQLADGDQDLYVEVIRFTETRNYIKYIYELYTIYEGLYGLE